MTKKYWNITEVIELFEVEERFIFELEEEEVICPECREDPSKKLYTTEDLEKLRLAKILMEEMGVNMEGIDIILRMRQNMIEMRRQFDEILTDLANEMKKGFMENTDGW